MSVVARGLLGIVLCGLIAAQISAITADVNSVATLFTSDVYRSLMKKAPTPAPLREDYLQVWRGVLPFAADEPNQDAGKANKRRTRLGGATARA